MARKNGEKNIFELPGFAHEDHRDDLKQPSRPMDDDETSGIEINNPKKWEMQKRAN